MTNKSNTITLGGVGIHYAEALGDGDALVLLHGITDSLDTYEPLLPELSQWAHVYALDLRGHGGSSNVGSYRAHDYAADVAAFIRTVIGRPAVVAGHSLGGLVAAALAPDAPRWVRGVLLEDPPMYLGDMARFHQTPFYDGFIALCSMLEEHAAAGGAFEDLSCASGSRMPVMAAHCSKQADPMLCITVPHNLITSIHVRWTRRSMDRCSMASVPTTC